MLRWTIAFIDGSKDRWERDRKEKENCRKMETISTWDLKTREEQKDSMREEWERSEMTDKEKWNMYRSIKVPTGAPKIGPSVALPGEMTCQQTQGDVDDLGAPVVTMPKVATQLGQSVAMQDVPRVSVTVPTRAPQPGLSVALPGEKIIQQDHNFDNSIIVTVPIGAQLGLSVALQGDMMCQQDDPGVKTPGISQLGQSVAMLSEMMRQKDNPGETVPVTGPGAPEIGQGVALHSDESTLIREELSEPSVENLSDIDCRLCRKIMRRVKCLRIDNVVRGGGGLRVKIGLSLEDQAADDDFPDNFQELISTKSFKSRKKSLLKKQISDFKKKSNIELPVVKEKKENLSVARLSQYDEHERSMSLEKASEVQDELAQQDEDGVSLGNVSELSLSLENYQDAKREEDPQGGQDASLQSIQIESDVPSDQVELCENNNSASWTVHIYQMGW